MFSRSVVYMYHWLFIYSSIDGHLACFQILAIVKNAVMNVGCTYTFNLVFWISLDIFPKVESLGHKAVPFLI